MYEAMTSNAILERMLLCIGSHTLHLDCKQRDEINKTLSAIASEFARLYQALDKALDESFADTQTREYLIRRAAERNIIPISDDEPDESIRKRYLDSFNISPFGGNRADYVKKAGAIECVLGAKVFPLGMGKVRLVFINLNAQSPSRDEIALVAEVFDPRDSRGMGEGLAPIGHFVEVEGVCQVPFEVEITVHPGTKISHEASCGCAAQYFRSLALDWAAVEKIGVCGEQIKHRLQKTTCKPIKGVQIKSDGVKWCGSVTLPGDSIPALGTLVIKEA